jgi:hypothetical protein
MDVGEPVRGRTSIPWLSKDLMPLPHSSTKRPVLSFRLVGGYVITARALGRGLLFLCSLEGAS